MFIDHIHFYVQDALKTRNWLGEKMGFRHLSQIKDKHTHREILTNFASIFFVISSPLNHSSPVYSYLSHHPSGIVDIAFRVHDIESIYQQILSDKLTVIKPIQTYALRDKKFKFTKIKGWHQLEHTLLENNTLIPSCLLLYQRQQPEIIIAETEKYWLNKNKFDTNINNYLTEIDHLVLNVAKGDLGKAARFYENIFGFKYQKNYRINTNYSGLYSEVFLSPNNNFYLNINEPTSPTSQIQEFIDFNGGAGIQHIALKSTNIIKTVTEMRNRGLSFLPMSKTYYRLLKQQGRNGLIPNLTQPEWQAIEKLKILVDFQPQFPESLLMQIFSKPIFNEPTFFFELIERRKQARGFGEGNFQALFELLEKEQIK